MWRGANSCHSCQSQRFCILFYTTDFLIIKYILLHENFLKIIWISGFKLKKRCKKKKIKEFLFIFFYFYTNETRSFNSTSYSWVKISNNTFFHIKKCILIAKIYHFLSLKIIIYYKTHKRSCYKTYVLNGNSMIRMILNKLLGTHWVGCLTDDVTGSGSISENNKL